MVAVLVAPRSPTTFGKRTWMAYSHAKAMVRTLSAWGIPRSGRERIAFQPDPKLWGASAARDKRTASSVNGSSWSSTMSLQEAGRDGVFHVALALSATAINERRRVTIATGAETFMRLSNQRPSNKARTALGDDLRAAPPGWRRGRLHFSSQIHTRSQSGCGGLSRKFKQRVRNTRHRRSRSAPLPNHSQAVTKSRSL